MPPGLIVASQPVLGVEPSQIAEARRALIAQGRTVADGAVERLLWVARALPTALDVLADTRNVALSRDGEWKDGEVMRGVEIELGPAEPFASPTLCDRGMLIAVGHREGDAIIVRIVARDALLAAEDGEAAACCTVRFLIHVEGGDSVAVHRFTLGPS